MKTHFHDAHERRQYTLACETARRIVRDPALIEDARRFVERAMAPDPHQAVYTTMWRDLLSRPASVIATALIEDSDRGGLLRETSPVFGPGYTSREIAAILNPDGMAMLLKTPMPTSAPDPAELTRRLISLAPPLE